MAIVTVNGQVNTTKVFASVIGAMGPMGPPGPSVTSAINLSQRTVDINPFKTIVDENIGVTNITVHTEPANPQYTHTILLSELPVSADIQDYMAIITIGGQNVDIADDNLNWQITRNGVDLVASGNGYSPAGLYWYTAVAFAANALAVGDVLGIKFWTDTSVLINFAYATVYIVPRTLAIPEGFQSTSNGTSYTQDVITGAASGVTYHSGNIVGLGYYDSVLALPISTYSSGGTAFISTYATPIQAMQTVASQYAVDNSRVVYNVDAAPSLFRIFAESFFRILQNYDFVVGSPVALPNPAGHEGQILQVVNGIPTWV